MPAILPPSSWDQWLRPDEDDVDALTSLLLPAPEGLLVWHPVSTEVNDARHRGAHLVDPVALPDRPAGSGA